MPFRCYQFSRGVQKHDTFAALTVTPVRLSSLCHRLPVMLISLAAGSVIESCAECAMRTARTVSNATACVLPFFKSFIVEQKREL